VFELNDKEVLQLDRRRALFVIGGVLTSAVFRPFSWFAAGESAHAKGQNKFIVVDHWVMLKEDLL